SRPSRRARNTARTAATTSRTPPTSRIAGIQSSASWWARSGGASGGKPSPPRDRVMYLLGPVGNRLAADEEGDPGDAPVVLLHGGGQPRHSWGTTLGAVARKGWHAYAVDLRGHGESDWAPDGDYTLDAFAGDVLAIAHALDSPPVLVGASLGGIA